MSGAEAPIGMVLGTEDVTPTVFWFAVKHGASVGLDDLVVVETRKPDSTPVRFYGLVDSVRKRHEGVTFESDVEDVVAGLLPATVSYAARVLVTRVDPENFIPPQPGDVVQHATGKELDMALSADKMEEAAFPGGPAGRRAAAAAQLPLHQRRVGRAHQHFRDFRCGDQDELRAVSAAFHLPQRGNGPHRPEKRRAAKWHGGGDAP